jgi:hypothetical protein
LRVSVRSPPVVNPEPLEKSPSNAGLNAGGRPARAGCLSKQRRPRALLLLGRGGSRKTVRGRNSRAGSREEVTRQPPQRPGSSNLSLARDARPGRNPRDDRG